jgi:hypothetical protein
VKGFVHKHKKLSAVLPLLCLVGGRMGWEASARIRGQLVAHFDVTRGHYRILAMGLAVSWRPEYIRLLRALWSRTESPVLGFRTYRVLELALYHSLGKLPEPESTHDFF